MTEEQKKELEAVSFCEMPRHRVMTDEQKKAVEAIQTVVDAAVKKGLFNDAKTVAAVHAAMAIIVEGLTK